MRIEAQNERNVIVLSCKAVSWVWDYSKSYGVARLVMLALAENANCEGEVPYSAVPLVAQMCRRSQEDVIEYINTLSANGQLDADQGRGIYIIPVLEES